MSEIHQVLIYILIGVILGSFLFLFLSRLFRRRGPVVQGEPRSFSEKEVEEFLKRSGFEILGKRQKETVITRVDGKDRFGYIEADYTVRKGRKKYVVVVQSGLEASDPNEPMLRRKLLEFDHVFHPHALLVVDLSRGEIHEVNFRFPYERNIDFFFRFLIALFIIAMVIGIIWMLVQLRLI
ncbi:hypothetical protein AMJ44_07205 [candidate division WOR-1 bacterium DG_54_3]|uniref:Uncharacterized protein n=1 Tax=candidate division WOR-1 bacterium DG_54_3 TaxID=1703775 RepID=A0A0S7XYL5_UNCSA|nr:MAG: hypothetical protein AMJ44_07205 [candidate division WOR-1 bacterium DG_54_3]